MLQSLQETKYGLLLLLLVSQAIQMKFKQQQQQQQQQKITQFGYESSTKNRTIAFQ